MTLGWAHVLIALVALARLIEVAYARQKTAALMARGGVESGQSHYPLFALLHAAWLVAMAVFTALNPTPNWPLLVVFAVLQPLRLWTFRTLGAFATTRVITLAGAQRVSHGPYRFLRHPSYVIAACEVFVLPLALGMPLVALVFGGLNAVLISYRVSVENAAWRQAAIERPEPS
jgi:methyltransferase